MDGTRSTASSPDDAAHSTLDSTVDGVPARTSARPAEEPSSAVDDAWLALEAEHAELGDPVIDPILQLEGGTEESAAWHQASELDLDIAVAHVRRARAIARGYVLATRAGRPRDDAVAEIMGSFSVSRRAAENDLAEALLLAAHPRSITAVQQRRFGLRQLRALMDVLGGLHRDLADQVELEMLPELAGRPPARVREMARRVALRLDPHSAAERRAEAAKTRAMRLTDAGDGMAELILRVRVEQGLAVLHRAEQQTLHGDGSGRTRDQRRVDWVIDTLLTDTSTEPTNDRSSDCSTDSSTQGSAGSSTGPAVDGAAAPSAPDPTPGAELVLDRRRRRPVQVLVHVPVTTALGLDDEPCQLDGIGPIDADHGRLLLSTAELRKVCVDAVTGEVLHVEGTVVRPMADPARSRQLRRTGLTGEQALPRPRPKPSAPPWSTWSGSPRCCRPRQNRSTARRRRCPAPSRPVTPAATS